MRRSFKPLFLNLRRELKRQGYDLDFVADYLTISRRALNMRLSNIIGSEFRLCEMYAILHLLGENASVLAYYFPEEEERSRANA